jgi:diacylglycerol kinase (ATP)
MTGIRDAVLIYNPMSGGRRHRRVADVEKAARILQESGINVELAPTTKRLGATEIARRAVTEKRDLVIACGGDGTINEIVNGLAGSDIPMALLPAGTANILAKELGVPWDIPGAAKLIANGEIRRIALGLAVPLNGNHSEAMPKEGRYFLSVAGAGPDGAIVNGVDEELKKSTGIFAYWFEGLRQLFSYRFPEMCVRSNGKSHKATIIVVGRTANYGGPFKITTEASLYEPTFELLTNSKRSRFAYLLCLPALWMGSLRTVDGIDAWKATETVCEPAGNEPVFAQVDGEPVGPLPMAFRIVPDALSIIAPASTAAPAR